MLTDIVSLVRYTLHQDGELVPAAGAETRRCRSARMAWRCARPCYVENLRTTIGADEVT